MRQALMPSGATSLASVTCSPAAPDGGRHAVDGDVQRQALDAHAGGQQAHRIAHAKRGIAGAQHQAAEAQQDVQRFGSSVFCPDMV